MHLVRISASLILLARSVLVTARAKCIFVRRLIFTPDVHLRTTTAAVRPMRTEPAPMDTSATRLVRILFSSRRTKRCMTSAALLALTTSCILSSPSMNMCLRYSAKTAMTAFRRFSLLSFIRQTMVLAMCAR